MPPSLVTTRRLALRPLTRADLRHPDVERWHLDPEGYQQMHEVPYADASQFRSTATAWVTAWAEGGPSYWLAIDRASGDPVGLGGVRRLVFEDVDYLNLYYRLGPAARGRGLGREIATAAVAHAREWCPDLPVVARVAAGNDHSLRVARACGLRSLGPWRAPDDPAEQPAPVLLTAPVALTGPPEDAAAYDALVTLWRAVNSSGGAVGFPGAVPRAEVEAALDRHLAQVENGQTALIRIAEPTPQTWADPTSHGRLLGFGFAHRYSGPAAHRANLERIMVDPRDQRRGLGRVLLADLTPGRAARSSRSRPSPTAEGPASRASTTQPGMPRPDVFRAGCGSATAMSTTSRWPTGSTGWAARPGLSAPAGRCLRHPPDRSDRPRVRSCGTRRGQ